MHSSSFHCVCVQLLSSVQLFAAPWTIACQAPLCMEFSRQEYWSELPSLTPFIIVPLNFNWLHGCPVRDHTSQPSLQLVLPRAKLWPMGNEQKRGLPPPGHTSRRTGLPLSSCSSPFPLAEARSWWWGLKQSFWAWSWKSCSEVGRAALPALVCLSLTLYVKQKYSSVFFKSPYLGVSLSIRT